MGKLKSQGGFTWRCWRGRRIPHPDVAVLWSAAAAAAVAIGASIGLVGLSGGVVRLPIGLIGLGERVIQVVWVGDCNVSIVSRQPVPCDNLNERPCVAS